MVYFGFGDCLGIGVGGVMARDEFEMGLETEVAALIVESIVVVVVVDDDCSNDPRMRRIPSR